MHPWQREAARLLYTGCVAVIAACGGGKTAASVLSVMVRNRLEGRTGPPYYSQLVVSPLNVLKANQQQAFAAAGVPCCAYSPLQLDATAEERRQHAAVLRGIKNCEYMVVLVVPEALVGEGAPLRDLFRTPHWKKWGFGFVIDEAHLEDPNEW